MVNGQDKGKILVKVLNALPDKIDLVKYYIEQKKFEQKCAELNRIISVFEVLEASLDMSYGEIPRNLSSLYRYIVGKLREVHSTLDHKTLNECKAIVRSISEGFEIAERVARSPQTKGNRDSAGRFLGSLTA
jgi:flagellar protein FliS